MVSIGRHRTSLVRDPAVAGRFYPGRAERLAADVDGYIAAAAQALEQRPVPAGGAGEPGAVMAVVAPHAGYIYSGPTAGFAYAVLDPLAVDRVVVLGPAHFVPVPAIGLSSAEAWLTPLGEVPVDSVGSRELAGRFGYVTPADDALAPEHSLEVQVPFLQRRLRPGWTLLPLIVGRASTEQVAEVVLHCSAWARTLVVVSTDLSHYLPYDMARHVDARTLAAIAGANAGGVSDSDACGAYALRGLLAAAARSGWSMRQLDARNSGDTAGDHGRVVGYCAFASYRGSGGVAVEPAAGGIPSQGASPPPESLGAEQAGGANARLSDDLRAALLNLARDTIMAELHGDRRPDWRTVAEQFRVAGEPGAAFVTLRTGSGELLGCIGSLEPRQALARDVAEHAFDAAFRDWRFPRMTSERARDMVIDISVLGPTQPFAASSYDDLVTSIRPGTGLVVDAGRNRATFLPAVWESLPEPAGFVAALWRKAGLAAGHWPRDISVQTYEVEEFGEA